MPERANDHTSRTTIRQTVEEGTQHLPERVRELPSIAVRTTVVGIGKLLQAADRVRTEYGEVRRNGVTSTLERLGREGVHFLHESVPGVGSSHTREEAQATGTSSRTATPPPTVAEPPPPPPSQPQPQPSEPPRAAPQESSSAAAPPETQQAPPAHDELPLSHYDELTVASLRARLRYLTISDLGVLLAYERSHQDRSNVVTMFENRILKLEREQGT